MRFAFSIFEVFPEKKLPSFEVTLVPIVQQAPWKASMAPLAIRPSKVRSAPCILN